MNHFLENTAKRTALIILAASGLAGCAVYDPAYGPYQTGPYGQTVYSDPLYHSYPQPYYQGPPVYVQPPLFFDFSYRSRGPHSYHDHGWGGGRGFWRGESGGHGGSRPWGDGRGRHGGHRR